MRLGWCPGQAVRRRRPCGSGGRPPTKGGHGALSCHWESPSLQEEDLPGSSLCALGSLRAALIPFRGPQLVRTCTPATGRGAGGRHQAESGGHRQPRRNPVLWEGDTDQLGALKTCRWEKASSGGHQPGRTEGVPRPFLAIAQPTAFPWPFVGAAHPMTGPELRSWVGVGGLKASGQRTGLQEWGGCESWNEAQSSRWAPP